jgi:SnoaL-like domain
MKHSKWRFYRHYLEVLDRYDLDGYTSLLADDVAIQFNNEAPMVGVDVARVVLSQFWSSVTAMGYTLLHEPLNIYGDDQHWVMEALNHYDTADGRRITVRATAWTDADADGKVASVRLYQDLSALYAPSS